MDRPLTLESLLSKYKLGLHITKEIKPEDRAILAQMFHMDNIICFFNQVGLTLAQKSDVECKFARSTEVAMIKALEFWSDKNPSSATYENLLLCVLQQRKASIAVAVCEYLSKQANEVCSFVLNYTTVYVGFLGVRKPAAKYFSMPTFVDHTHITC